MNQSSHSVSRDLGDEDPNQVRGRQGKGKARVEVEEEAYEEIVGRGRGRSENDETQAQEDPWVWQARGGGRMGLREKMVRGVAEGM